VRRRGRKIVREKILALLSLPTRCVVREVGSAAAAQPLSTMQEVALVHE
jgi:hypothetical protein